MSYREDEHSRKKEIPKDSQKKIPKEKGPRRKCECPKCGNLAAQKKGIPCTQQKCPECGANMIKG